MIANIDSQADITIYFDKKEIKKLANKQQLIGVLIREYGHSLNPSCGTIEAQVDQSKANFNNCFGIGIDDKDYWGIDNFKVRVYIGDYYFNRLQQNGSTGTRQSMLDGSKITLETMEKLDGIERYGVNDMIEIARRHT